MTTTAISPAVAFWRRTFNGGTGYIYVFSGVRSNPGAKKLTSVRRMMYPYPLAVGNAETWLQGEGQSGRETYAGAALFKDKDQGGKNSNVGKVTAIWVDGDGCTVPANQLQPTITVETSPGRWNYYWLLNEPVTAEQAEDLNRRMAYAIGADPSGWDANQLLRVPGLPNRKYPDAPIVQVIADDGPVYTPSELDAALPPAPTEAPKRRSTSASGGPDGEDEPPIRGMDPKLWRGERTVERDGRNDESGVLWQIACDAEEHGATEPLIAWIFKDRDQALGFNKYTSRPGMYQQQAHKVMERERKPRWTLILEDDEPKSEPSSEVARLRAERDAARAERDELRAVNRGIVAIVHSDARPAVKVANIALAFEAHSNRSEDFTSISGIAGRIHQSDDSVSSTLAAQRIVVEPVALRATTAAVPFVVVSETRMANPWTGEITDMPRTYTKLAPTRARLSETLAALSDVPEELKKKERVDRGTRAKPEAIPDELIPLCPEDDAAGTTQKPETLQVARCEDCGTALAAMTEDGELFTLPAPILSDQGPPPTPEGGCGHGTYLCTDIIGTGVPV